MRKNQNLKIYTRESIDASRLELIRLFDSLQRLVCRVYRLSYESLKEIGETNDDELAVFRVYSNRKIFELLDSRKLEVDNFYSNGTFDITPRMLDIRHYMTFEEFIDTNIRDKYPNACFIDRIYDEPEVIWSRFDDMECKRLITKRRIQSDGQMLDEFIAIVRQAVEALESIKYKLRYLQFDVDEDFVFNRSEWMVADNIAKAQAEQIELEMSPSEKIRQEIVDSVSTLFTLMHKRFSVDYSQLTVFEDLDSDELIDFKLFVDHELDRLAKKCGLDKSVSYLDYSFRLEPFSLNATDLTSFINFIESNDILYSELDNYVMNKEISDKMIQMNQILQSIDGTIRMYKAFDNKFTAFNDRLVKMFNDDRRKRAIRRARSKPYEHYIEELEDIAAELERSVGNAQWHLKAIYSIDSMYRQRLKDLTEEDYNEIKDRYELEIDKILEKYDLDKDVIFGTDSFSLRPSNLDISKDMSLQDFVQANIPLRNRSTGITETIASCPIDELRYKIPKILIRRRATKQKTEKDIIALKSVIDILRNVISEYVRFRSELRELNRHLLREYRQKCRR